MEDRQNQGQVLGPHVALAWPSAPALTFPLNKGWPSLPELTALVLVGALILYHKTSMLVCECDPRSPGPPGQLRVLQYPVGECALEMALRGVRWRWALRALVMLPPMQPCCPS